MGLLVSENSAVLCGFHVFGIPQFVSLKFKVVV